MKILIFTAFLALSIYTASFILAVSPANAETIGIAITQNTYDLDILPGDSYTGQITVFNQSESLPLPINVKLNLWNLKEDSDDIEFIISEDALNAARWFDLGNATNYLLGIKDTAEEDKQVNFTINVPAETPPGSYFVIMRFEAVIPPHYYIESGPRANPEISALFFIRVPNLNLDGAVSDYDAEISELAPRGAESIDFLARIFPNAEAGVFEDMVKEILARVRNTGIYHFTAKGTVTIHNMFGAEVARGELPQKIMMPSRTRSMDILAESTGGFLTRNFNLGPYTATMVLEVPGNGEPIVETIYFWAFPWKVLSAVFSVLFLLILFRNRIFGAMRALFSR